ncbi:hypothetical protein BO78DRAFT_365794 [Aspergillus sclerotiicarbonarius CBS 121057]|uniref:Uncharacterized protein n=1 Tax=Aspergillus sclerotiicarbonarius (strain CBS 121057 / IBT 28362) TaxID=1448318 RepID=A0A319ECE5_ASPSB|nr:hypothetical protein BO78DRAFT_365794 [Aspergillus sclerotiicarbonarius CBS 121057]
MNWTGGRLRRHSDIHARNKKQHFRKPRPTAKGPLTTLFNNLSPLEESRDLDPGDELRQISDQQPSQAAQRLDNIKRRLLKKSDWASVGVARPLKVLFPPVEVLRKFGRRRRITEDDRERLGSSVSRPNPIRNTKHSEDAVSDIGTIQGLDIRINGRPVGADRSNRSQPANVSSQSMLLDCEESTPAKQNPFVQKSGSDNVDRISFDERSWILGSSSVSLLCSSPNRILSTPDDSIQGSEYMIDEFSHKDQSRDIGLEPLRSGSSSEMSPEIPIRRRFTIDDQILAEQEGKLNICNASLGPGKYGASQQFGSPPHLRGSSSALEGSNRTAHESTGTSSTLNHSSYGWLPEPRHNIQRSISRTDRNALDFKPYGFRYHEDSLSQLSITAQQSTSPVKLYGQSILDGDQITRHMDFHRDRQAEPSFTYSPVASDEDDNVSAGGYPFEANTFRTDSFALSPNTFRLKPTIAPRSGIYIDQARGAEDRVFLANPGTQPQECSGGYLQPRFRCRD